MKAKETMSLEFLFTPDGILDKAKLSWITEPQKNALIMQLFSELKIEEAKNKTKVASNKRLNQQIAELELELYDLKYKKEKV